MLVLVLMTYRTRFSILHFYSGHCSNSNSLGFDRREFWEFRGAGREEYDSCNWQNCAGTKKKKEKKSLSNT